MSSFIVRGYVDDEEATDSILRDTRLQAAALANEWLDNGTADEVEIEDLAVTFGEAA